MSDSPHSVLVATWYNFHPIDQPECVVHDIQKPEICGGIKGLIIVASEGVNGTIAGPSDSVLQFVDWLKARIQSPGLTPRLSHAQRVPMHRFKVLLRPEIVTLGVPETNPGTLTGQHISSEAWNEVISDAQTMVIDTRNDYEVAIGSFEGAINPKTETFRDFVQWVHDNEETLRAAPRIAMFCTGGVRCEKASTFMLNEGYENILQLDGGILAYLEQVPQADSAWNGQCFVFDERVSVGHGLEPGALTRCRGCRHPLTPEDMARPEFEEGVSCHRCIDQTTEGQKARYRERWKQVALAAARGEEHLGCNTGMQRKALRN